MFVGSPFSGDKNFSFQNRGRTGPLGFDQLAIRFLKKEDMSPEFAIRRRKLEP